MGDRWQYLGVLLGCLLVTLPLEFLGAGVYRRAAVLARAVLPVVGVFAAWDVVAIARGHWTFAEEFTLGVVLPGGMPVEEVLFFVVVPVCAVLTYEAVSGMAARLERERAVRG
ncbi:lycopene cyclase domain-containing protein [Saccharothrix sp. CCNWLY140-2]|uniref:lycopene cyclase domain-containing protein n=1 Tax=Saccharothrix sp. CCNWLY140-2 TaxID=3138500 RepID=UPI003217B33D